ncbi:hypothetical protein PIIN_04910 [Serendipita indica DSM 11827]|uniref:Apoptogenic protein 1, mitochondrial n=1 Tax=Serendipita indica (strain DSM 11827) TaxID=1109443 RepID=G4TI35_SERID|nr:hypothetical protein PIIN_04910 [Serendipita indica DSM 11827]
MTLSGRTLPLGLVSVSAASLGSTMSKLKTIRRLHTSLITRNTLVGPPHPVSNLRPVLYNGLPDQTQTNNYSPRELRSHVPVDGTKFQLELSMQRIDKFNHEFWADSNKRFYETKDAFLRARQPRLDLAKTPEERSQMEEEHLAEFYRFWVLSERDTQRQYTSEWLRAQYGSIWTAARFVWQGWMQRLLPS